MRSTTSSAIAAAAAPASGGDGDLRPCSRRPRGTRRWPNSRGATIPAPVGILVEVDDLALDGRATPCRQERCGELAGRGRAGGEDAGQDLHPRRDPEHRDVLPHRRTGVAGSAVPAGHEKEVDPRVDERPGKAAGVGGGGGVRAGGRPNDPVIDARFARGDRTHLPVGNEHERRRSAGRPGDEQPSERGRGARTRLGHGPAGERAARRSSPRRCP